MLECPGYGRSREPLGRSAVVGLSYQATSPLGLGWRETLEVVGLSYTSGDVRSCLQLSFQDIQMLRTEESTLWSSCAPKVHQPLLSIAGVFVA